MKNTPELPVEQNQQPQQTVENQTPSYEKVEINGEIITCKRVEMLKLKEYASAFALADYYRKTAIVSARQATEREEITTSQDGMTNYADLGDWIIHNLGDKDPYVFGSKNDSIEKRQVKFAKKYDVILGEDGKFRAKGFIKAVQVNENIVFGTSWGETMAVKVGGWVAGEGYGIAEESFGNTYEKFDPKEEDQKKLMRLENSYK